MNNPMAKEVKPCLNTDCSRPRLYGKKLCYNCFRADLKKKKEEKKLKKIERSKKTKKYQTGQLKIWKDKTWRLMSEWVRRKDADFAGYVTCYTCPQVMQWREAHCGHFWHSKLDLDPRNLRVQGSCCNTYRHGNLGVYGARLIRENGQDWYDQLEKDAAQHKGYTLAEVMTIYYDLQEKLAKLQ